MTRRIGCFKKLAVVAVPLLALAVVGPAGAQVVPPDIARTAMLDCSGLAVTHSGQAVLVWMDAAGPIGDPTPYTVNISCAGLGTSGPFPAVQPNGGDPVFSGVATKWDLQLFIYEGVTPPPIPTGFIKTCHPGGRVNPGVPEEISKSCHAPGGSGFIKFTLMTPTP